MEEKERNKELGRLKELTPLEKAKLIEAVSEALITNKTMGSYTGLQRTAVEKLHLLIESI